MDYLRAIINMDKPISGRASIAQVKTTMCEVSAICRPTIPRGIKKQSNFPKSPDKNFNASIRTTLARDILELSKK